MSRLTNLLNYQSRIRRIGHTILMTEGIHFSRSALMLFANNAHAQIAFREALDRVQLGELEDLKTDFANLRIGNVRFKSIAIIDKLEEYQRGYKPEDMMPVVVDHFAMDLLVREHDKKRNEMIGAKE